MNFTLRSRDRCHHRSRRGLPCFRMRIHDYWCASHNHRCFWHSMDRNRCPRRPA